MHLNIVRVGSTGVIRPIWMIRTGIAGISVNVFPMDGCRRNMKEKSKKQPGCSVAKSLPARVDGAKHEKLKSALQTSLACRENVLDKR